MPSTVREGRACRRSRRHAPRHRLCRSWPVAGVGPACVWSAGERRWQRRPPRPRWGGRDNRRRWRARARQLHRRYWITRAAAGGVCRRGGGYPGCRHGCGRSCGRSPTRPGTLCSPSLSGTARGRSSGGGGAAVAAHPHVLVYPPPPPGRRSLRRGRHANARVGPRPARGDARGGAISDSDTGRSAKGRGWGASSRGAAPNCRRVRVCRAFKPHPSPQSPPRRPLVRLSLLPHSRLLSGCLYPSPSTPQPPPQNASAAASTAR